MKKFLLLLLTMFAVCTMQAQNEIFYGIYTGSGSLKPMGTEKAETYDVAMHLNDDALVGLQVVGVRIPMNTGVSLTDCQAWLTTELQLASGKNVANIATTNFTAEGQWVDVAFAEPYTITSDGVYVGYSVTVPAVDTEANKKPIMCVASEDVGSLYFHSSRTVRKWRNLPETAYYTVGAYAMVVRLSGEQVKTNAVGALPPDELSTFVLVGEKTTLTIPIVNHGTAAVSSIEYDLKVGNETFSRSAKVSLKGKYFGGTTNLKVEIPAIQESGSYDVEFRVTKVNGVDNEDPQPATHFTMAILSEFPKHKPLMEEYTGTWCQWCVSGIAAMEAMNKLYGDDFVGVAFHNGDVMTITSLYPNDVNSFPNGYLDRVQNVSPFFGSSGASLGIRDDWKKRANIVAPATLTMEARWTDEAQTKLEVTSTTTFVRDFANNPYQLTYILTADGLKGTGKEWGQQNGYAGGTSSDPYLSPYTKMGGLISDIEFNDVAIQLSAERSQAIAGSLPTSVKGNEGYQHTYVFDISANKLVQNKSKLRPVAVLINTRTGEVVNAEKVRVTDTNGIDIVTSDSQKTAVYDLQGRKVASSRSISPLKKGIYIVNHKKIIQ